MKSLVGKMSFKSMTKYFDGRTASSLQSHSRFINLNSPYIHKIHSKDENFWETPNSLNCYFAGILAADGYLYEKNGAKALKWAVSIIDKAHLEMLIKYTKFTGKITHYMHKSPSTDNVNEMVRVSFSSCDKWIKDLKNNFNLCQGKSLVLQGPNLSDNYLKLCFLIGYIDGDGCIHWDKTSKQPVIRFACCGLEILKWIKNIIEKDFEYTARKGRKPNINKRENHYIYCISGLRAAKLFDALSAIDVPKLDRKWKNPEFLAELALYKQKFPSFFVNSENSQLILDTLVEKV